MVLPLLFRVILLRYASVVMLVCKALRIIIAYNDSYGKILSRSV